MILGLKRVIIHVKRARNINLKFCLQELWIVKITINQWAENSSLPVTNSKPLCPSVTRCPLRNAFSKYCILRFFEHRNLLFSHCLYKTNKSWFLWILIIIFHDYDNFYIQPWMTKILKISYLSGRNKEKKKDFLHAIRNTTIFSI